MEQIISDSNEKYILVAVATGNEEAAWDSLDELADLLDTAGGITVCQSVQNLAHPDRATYIGKGKAAELKELLEIHDADGIICDDELTASQMRNLSELTESKVIDRTTLILDIFAAHARTREGKLQVEIAQQKYRYARLRGMGEALSRLGAGIGTRGPGEKKLEQDRRVIRTRVSQLKRELADIVSHRELTRKKREGNSVPVFAIVGYTHVGKSTLLNRLTGSEVLAENKLFATLDTTTRSLELEGKQQALLTDTVGFIRKLPHNLVDAFRSTLEEARYADYIIHVVDSSSENAEEDMRFVYETLDMLGIEGKKVLTVFNKIDKIGGEDTASDEKVRGLKDSRSYMTVKISAKTGDGIDDLLNAITTMIREDRRRLERMFSYSEMSAVSEIRDGGLLITEDYRDDGIYIEADVPIRLYNKYIGQSFED